jgi:hypothetical protein
MESGAARMELCTIIEIMHTALILAYMHVIDRKWTSYHISNYSF